MDQILPPPHREPCRLHAAMRYSTLNGGKRIRPLLVYSSGIALGVPLSQLHAPACAVEFVHTAHLIHDDLPAMDDDDTRRRQPSCHRAFNEPLALMAGDALISLAHETLAAHASQRIPAARRIAMLKVLSQSTGSEGVAGGQALDIQYTCRSPTLRQLENIHQLKTTALIAAAVQLGALPAIGPRTPVMRMLDQYAHCVGLAFQIWDDILDVIGDSSKMGKKKGADRRQNKTTYADRMNLTKAQQYAHQLSRRALAAIDSLGEQAVFLRYLARYATARER